MGKTIDIGGRIHNPEVGNVVTGANEILDDTKNKKQDVINSEVDAALEALDANKQDNLTFDQTPTESSTNPVTSGGVYAADALLQQAIEAILALIPSAATALNQLADKAFVNSTVATNTATFRGTYNVVTDLGLAYNASHQDIATALLSHIATADNNDYAFVQIPVSGTSEDIRVTERYKFNGTVWGYEYDLNNSGFTALQWAAINSGITALLVEKLGALPTAAELALALAGKQATLTFDNAPVSGSNNPVKSGGLYQSFTAIDAKFPSDASSSNKLVAENRLAAYVTAVIEALDVTYNVTSTDGHVTIRVTQVDGAISNVEVATNDIASAQALSTLGGRVTANETDLANLHVQVDALTGQKYVTVTATAGTTSPTDVLPSSGQETDTIYRIGSWDGTQYDPNTYSEYAWNGTAYQFLDKKTTGIDDVPTNGSTKLVESGGVKSELDRQENIMSGNLIFKDNISTIAGGVKKYNLHQNGLPSGLYAFKISDLSASAAVYFSLYNGTQLVKEDFLIKQENGVYEFESDVAFTELGIYSLSQVTFKLEVYNNIQTFVNERLVSRKMFFYANQIPLRYGNINPQGVIVDNYANVLSVDYLQIPSGSKKVWFSIPSSFTYTTEICFYDENKGFVSRTEVHSDLVEIPSTAIYYLLLFWDRPSIETVSNSGMCGCFILDYILPEDLDICRNIDTYGFDLDENDYELQKGNIGPNGQDENTQNVRTKSGIYYPIYNRYGEIVSCENWEMIVFLYAENKSFIRSISINRNSERQIDFGEAKYYRMVFYDTNGTLPNVSDITSDGFSVHFDSIVDNKIDKKIEGYDSDVLHKIVTDSNLEARKNDNYGLVLSKANYSFLRENGNIGWFGQQRLSQIPLSKDCTPDPTVVKIGDYYYMTCSYFPIKIYRSRDMVNWEFYRNVFPGTWNDPFNDGTTQPFGFNTSMLYYWAPSMFVHDGKVYLYIYTITWNYTDCATQLVVADDIDSVFTWVGTVHEDDVDNKEFRDTQHFKDTNGDIYISTGDASSTLGRRIAKMDSDLITVMDSWEISNAIHEGTLLYKHNGWYYLFFSDGNTASTTYNVRCFRSQNIENTIWEDCGTLLEQPDATNPLNSTGHVGEIITDNDGRLYMYMHCHCYGLTPDDVYSYDGYGTRYLYCQQIVFDNNDMPHFVDKDGNVTTLPQWLMECPNV